MVHKALHVPNFINLYGRQMPHLSHWFRITGIHNSLQRKISGFEPRVFIEQAWSNLLPLYSVPQFWSPYNPGPQGTFCKKSLYGHCLCHSTNATNILILNTLDTNIPWPSLGGLSHPPHCVHPGHRISAARLNVLSAVGNCRLHIHVCTWSRRLRGASLHRPQ